MSEWFYANILKSDASTVVAKNVYVQLDKMEAKEAVEYQSGDPHFTYRVYTRQLPTNNLNLVQQKYYVVDQQTIDPVTNQQRKFLIISDPTPKRLVMEWSWIVYRYRGI
jgi:hypothetical protein